MTINSTDARRFTLPLVVAQWGLFVLCVGFAVAGLFNPLTAFVVGVMAIVSSVIYIRP